MWEWITASRTNKTVTITAVVLTVLALTAVIGAWHFRGKMQESRKAEKEQAQKIETMEKEATLKDEAYRKAVVVKEEALKNALTRVRESKASLAQIEALRRGPWMVPAVDNGDLVARFERALERIQ